MSQSAAAKIPAETGISLELLDAIGDAFNSGDVDAIMPFFAEDAIFDLGAGPDVHGARISGANAIRAAFQNVFGSVETVRWSTRDARIVDDKAYCEFLRTAKLKSGETQEFYSLDIFTFRNGLIVHKDTYFKNRTG